MDDDLAVAGEVGLAGILRFSARARRLAFPLCFRQDADFRGAEMTPTSMSWPFGGLAHP